MTTTTTERHAITYKIENSDSQYLVTVTADLRIATRPWLDSDRDTKCLLEETRVPALDNQGVQKTDANGKPVFYITRATIPPIKARCDTPQEALKRCNRFLVKLLCEQARKDGTPVECGGLLGLEFTVEMDAANALRAFARAGGIDGKGILYG